MEKSRSAFKILTGKRVGKRSLGWAKRRWKEILKWIFKKLVTVRGIRLILLRIGIIVELL